MIKKILLLSAFFALPLMSWADSPDNPSNVLPKETPIDGGVSLLIAAGCVYAGKKYRDYKKNKEQE